MSEKSVKIRSAAAVPAAHGLALSESLGKQIADLENPQYRVAVVGDYQVGKSTLINRVFFGDKPLLAEGIGITKTAIATDVEYGTKLKMDVFHWADPSRTAETLVQTKDSPSEADILEATAPKAQEVRREIAKNVSRVCIDVPNEALRGYTVIDTPGLNDPDQELLFNTTWRIIPGADVAILVVEARQLGDTQLNLLRKEIMGRNGISRILVLVSYRPNNDWEPEQRKDILDTIKAQLSSIGRDDIQVEMYCFDASVEDIIGDVSELRLLIRSFLNDNALPGREEKVANLLRAELEALLVEVAAKLKAAGATEAEKAALAEKVEAQVEQFKRTAEESFERFEADVQALGDELKHDVDMGVEAVFDKFVADLENQPTVDGMKNVVGHADVTLKSDLNDKVSIVGLKLKTELTDLVAKYAKDMDVARREWNVFLSDEFHVNKPFVAKIPTLALDAINVVALNFILPGGWIFATVAHVLGKPFFDPTAFIAKKIIVSKVKNGLNETKPEIIAQIMQQIHEVLSSVFGQVKAGMEAENQAQVAAIRAGLSASPAADADRASLESAKKELEEALATL